MICLALVLLFRSLCSCSLAWCIPFVFRHGLIIYLCYVFSSVLLQIAAPKAEFRRGKSDDTFATNDDDGDDCSLVGAEMNLDVVDHERADCLVLTVESHGGRDLVQRQ